MTAPTTTTVAETFLTKWPKLIRATTTDIGISFNFKFHSTNLSRKNLVHLHLPGGSIVGQWLIRNSNALISNKNTKVLDNVRRLMEHRGPLLRIFSFTESLYTQNGFNGSSPRQRVTKWISLLVNVVTDMTGKLPNQQKALSLQKIKIKENDAAF